MNCFLRCTQIWHKCHRPKSAEIIGAILSTQLKTPCVTRWNSLYDAVNHLIMNKENLGELCYRLGVSNFLASEIQYLEEYLQLLKPIAEAIDFLQSEKSMFFGYFIPTLVSIRVKMRRLESEQFLHLAGINIEMQLALLKRFEIFFYLKEESLDPVIAAIVIPDVKLKFLNILLETAKTFTVDDIKSHLIRYGLQFTNNYKQTPKSPSTPSTSSFLDFGDESSGKSCIF